LQRLKYKNIAVDISSLKIPSFVSLIFAIIRIFYFSAEKVSCLHLMLDQSNLPTMNLCQHINHWGQSLNPQVI